MNELIRMAANWGLKLDDEMAAGFGLYQALLLDWNGRMNLTAITEPREMAVKHFLDSLLLLKWWDIGKGAAVIDVGTGAGFPGIPLKIARPDLRLTLLDSLQKRVRFLEELSSQLGQSNLCLHGRAEETAHRPDFREQYDLACARAVARLSLLCEYCLPFVKTGGVFLAMKGAGWKEEAQSAGRAIALLGGHLAKTEEYTLPDGSSRAMLVIEKISQTPTKYPRTQAKMTKAPL